MRILPKLAVIIAAVGAFFAHTHRKPQKSFLEMTPFEKMESSLLEPAPMIPEQELKRLQTGTPREAAAFLRIPWELADTWMWEDLYNRCECRRWKPIEDAHCYVCTPRTATP